MGDTKEDTVAKVTELGPWFHQIELEDGIRTRDIDPCPGPQPVDHPLPRWEKVMNALPEDLSGKRVLDLGCSDGFFSLEMARRGASEIVSLDAAGKAIARLDWLTGYFGIDTIKPRVADIYDLPTDLGSFDFVFMFALLYHLKEPLLGLEIVSSLADELYIESIAINDEENSHLRLQLPREGVHQIPKWFPTTRCLKDMLRWVGFENIEELAPPEDDRPIYRATK